MEANHDAYFAATFPVNGGDSSNRKAENTAKKEPDDSERMQMTDGRCSRCNEGNVGLREIIQAGHGDRYQLECIPCGYSWYASRDEASTLTIEGPSFSAKNVGTVPLATTKFDSLEKKLLNPRDSDTSANDVLKKSSEANMPVLEAQGLFSKSKNKDNNNNNNNNPSPLSQRRPIRIRL